MPDLLILGLAAWRIAYALVEEPGPWQLLARLRARFGVEHDEFGYVDSAPIGSVFACVGCMSIWVAGALWFLPWGVSMIFATAAVAKLVMEGRDRLGLG